MLLEEGVATEMKMTAVALQIINQGFLAFTSSLLIYKLYDCAHGCHTRNLLMYAVSIFILIILLPVSSFPYFSSLYKHI